MFKRKNAKKKIKKQPSSELKTTYNKLPGQIKKSSSEFYENKWNIVEID